MWRLLVVYRIVVKYGRNTHQQIKYLMNRGFAVILLPFSVINVFYGFRNFGYSEIKGRLLKSDSDLKSGSLPGVNENLSQRLSSVRRVPKGSTD